MHPELHFDSDEFASLEPDQAILAQLEQHKGSTRVRPFNVLRTSKNLFARLEAIDRIGQSITYNVYDGQPRQAQYDWEALVQFLYAALDYPYRREFLYRIARWAPSKRCLTQAISAHPGLSDYYYGTVCSPSISESELRATPLVSYKGPNLPAPLARNAPLKDWIEGFKAGLVGWDCFYYLSAMGFNVQRSYASGDVEHILQASIIYAAMVELVANGPYGGLTATAPRHYHSLVGALKTYAPSSVDAAQALVKVLQGGNALVQAAAAWELSSMQLGETESVFLRALTATPVGTPGHNEIAAAYERFKTCIRRGSGKRYCDEIIDCPQQ